MTWGNLKENLHRFTVVFEIMDLELKYENIKKKQQNYMIQAHGNMETS